MSRLALFVFMLLASFFMALAAPVSSNNTSALEKRVDHFGRVRVSFIPVTVTRLTDAYCSLGYLVRSWLGQLWPMERWQWQDCRDCQVALRCKQRREL